MPDPIATYQKNMEAVQRVRDALLGIFSDYDFACKDVTQARAIWEQMRVKMVRMETMLAESKRSGADEWNKRVNECLGS